jgi:uncharacterized repeat protein (TIGR03843 family)
VREAAAYVLSEALGWGLVPETLVRDDLPLGTGSLQRFIDAEFEHHYFTLLEEPSTHDALRKMATFDLLANNADRKSGHVLLAKDGHIWGIDHGLCFHSEPKLRTVMWDFCGETLPSELRPDIERLMRDMPASLGSLLNGRERDAICRRASAVLRTGVFPDPGNGRPYPWPLV